MPRARPARRAPREPSALLPPGVAPAVRARDTGMLLEALEPLLTAHAGSIRGAHKFALYKVAEADLKDAGGAIEWAGGLASRREPVAKEFAAHLCAVHVGAFDEHADEVLDVLKRCADDENWEVRETAAGVLSRYLVRRPEDFALVLRTWSQSRSANQRRAVVVAVKLAARVVPAKAGELLDLLEPLAADPDEYVRRNLGPFALGDGLLRAAPDLTLKRLARWAKDRDEWVRWNVASAFTAAEARRHIEAALPILRVLAADTRPMVARAVVRALVNLAQGNRAAVLRGVGAWGEDEPRRAAASALKARLVGRAM